MNTIKMEVPFFQAPNDIFEIGLTANELIIYLYLARCGNNSKAFPSYKTIGEKTGTSRPTAMRVIKKLEEIGLLYKESRKFVKETTEKQKVFNKSNVYTVQHDLSSVNRIGSITEIPPLVSDRHHPSVTVIPYKELYNNNYLDKELSYMTVTNSRCGSDLNYNSKDDYLKDIESYNQSDLTTEIFSLFYDKYLENNKNYNHYRIKEIDLHICTSDLIEIEKHLEDNYPQFSEVEILKEYLNWYFETNKKHSIKNFASIKAFNTFFVKKYKQYLDNENYFEAETGKVRASYN